MSLPADDLDQATAEAAAPSPAPRAPAVQAGSLFWWLILVVMVADQISKYFIRTSLALYESVTVIPGFADFTYVQNTGLAYGLFNSADLPFKRVITVGLALAALAGIMYFARQVRRDERLARVGLSLILAGALGNLIDRFILGFVVDFVDLYWNAWHFWAFNVADASITFGAICVFADLLTSARHAPDSV